MFITKRLKLFWKKYCDLLFLAINFFAILIPYFSFWYFLRHPDIQKQKLGCEWACETKKY